MSDILGPRGVFAVVGPSTNTTVQPELEAMRPPGVTLQYRAFLTEDPAQPLTEAAFVSGVSAMSGALDGAFRQALSCKPDALLLGISLLSFEGGRAGAEALQRELDARCALPVTLGSLALDAALQALGRVRRVALLTPYVPAANAKVRRFLEESGYVVVRDTALCAPSWTGIARIPPASVEQALAALDGDDVEALVQVGTNLPMLALAARAEVQRGKPVLPVNVATWWCALRRHGLNDRMPGFGRLLAEC